jgi:hypothetical protein
MTSLAQATATSVKCRVQVLEVKKIRILPGGLTGRGRQRTEQRGSERRVDKMHQKEPSPDDTAKIKSRKRSRGEACNGTGRYGTHTGNGGDHSNGCENDIKTDLKEIWRERVDWILL